MGTAETTPAAEPEKTDPEATKDGAAAGTAETPPAAEPEKTDPEATKAGAAAGTAEPAKTTPGIAGAAPEEATVTENFMHKPIPRKSDKVRKATTGEVKENTTTPAAEPAGPKKNATDADLAVMNNGGECLEKSTFPKACLDRCEKSFGIQCRKRQKTELVTKVHLKATRKEDDCNPLTTSIGAPNYNRKESLSDKKCVFDDPSEDWKTESKIKLAIAYRLLLGMSMGEHEVRVTKKMTQKLTFQYAYKALHKLGLVGEMSGLMCQAKNDGNWKEEREELRASLLTWMDPMTVEANMGFLANLCAMFDPNIGLEKLVTPVTKGWDIAKNNPMFPENERGLVVDIVNALGGYSKPLQHAG